ncbi:MAG TPA: glycosyltransferase family 39 protein, partial [Streptosporangiaceae bacterium]|nr:glycosyltransferase family 39 protein [Streptosporangiaceae bacterium]
LATRLPSVLGMAGAAWGITVIGRRLGSPRAGLWAGLLFAALPMVTQEAHDARPYGLVTAAAVLASLVLIRGADDPRPGWFAGYALSLALLGYLEVFALLLVPAHAITLTRLGGQPARPGPGRQGRRFRDWAWPDGYLGRRWMVAVAAAGAALTPVLAGAWLQRGQIGWLRSPGWFDLGYLASSLATGGIAGAAALALLAIVGTRRGDSPAQAEAPHQLTGLALPWLILPPLVLVAISEVHPIYTFRYVVFCLPSVALLAGAGLAALGPVSRTVALALVVTLAVPAQLSLRIPGSGIGVAMGAATQVLASQERAGDAIVYPGSSIPPWYLAYPRAFGPLRDISLAQPGAAIGRLYGSSVSVPALKRRERGVQRIWVVEMAAPWRSPAPYIGPGFRLAHRWWPAQGRASLWLYERFQ